MKKYDLRHYTLNTSGPVNNEDDEILITKFKTVKRTVDQCLFINISFIKLSTSRINANVKLQKHQFLVVLHYHCLRNNLWTWWRFVLSPAILHSPLLIQYGNNLTIPTRSLLISSTHRYCLNQLVLHFFCVQSRLPSSSSSIIRNRFIALTLPCLPPHLPNLSFLLTSILLVTVYMVKVRDRPFFLRGLDRYKLFAIFTH